MKKLLLTCFVLILSTVSAIAEVSVGVNQENVLPVIEPPPMNSCEQREMTEIKDSVKINTYDNVPIFNQNKGKKINVMLKQPSASLGSQQ